MLPYHDETLLQRIANGDESAFSKMYHATNRNIYNAVMVYVKNEDATREIVQLVYIKLWNSRRKLFVVERLEDYLFIVARNLVFDHFKKMTLETRLVSRLKEQVHEPVNDAAARFHEKEFNKLLQEAVSALPPRQREAYLLASEEELSYESIAARMHLSRLTVKRHLEEARRSIRNFMRYHLDWLIWVCFLFIPFRF
jgi:RNA polymerase sigma-70 factor (ECF subfamily)